MDCGFVPASVCCVVSIWIRSRDMDTTMSCEQHSVHAPLMQNALVPKGDWKESSASTT